MTPIAAPYDSGEGLHTDERKGHRPSKALTGFALYRLDTRKRTIDMATRLPQSRQRFSQSFALGMDLHGFG